MSLAPWNMAGLTTSFTDGMQYAPGTHTDVGGWIGTFVTTDVETYGAPISIYGSGGIVRRGEAWAADQWAVNQTIVPLDDAQGSSIGVRCGSDSGYFLTDMSYTAYSGEWWFSLNRMIGGISTIIAQWMWGHQNPDGAFRLLEVQTVPGGVELRASIAWANGYQPFPSGIDYRTDPDPVSGTLTSPHLLGTFTDTSANRILSGVPGFSVGGNKAGGCYNFIAGPIYSLSASSATASGITSISGSRVPGSTITVTDTPAAPLFGTASSPMNRPISAWEADIKSHYSTTSIVDSAATSDVTAALAATSASERLLIATGQDSFPAYWAQSGDTEYNLLRGPTYSYGQVYSLLDNPGGTAVNPTKIRVPTGAHVWQHLDDQHLTVVDVERNRITACYASSDVDFGTGFVAGGFVAQYRGTDILRGTDATILAAQAAATRYAYSGGASSYPTSGAGLCGLGAGIPSGSVSGETAANGDTNGYVSPHGIIMPEDFDDTGWTGEAIGTLHHALYCVVRTDSAYGCVWPVMDPGGGTAGKSLKNGQIIRLDPAFVIPSDTAPHHRRILRTMQVYGLVVSDWASSQMLKMSGQGNWAGLGPQRSAGSPWAITGQSWSAEANAFAAEANGNGVVYLPTLTGLLTAFQAILPHGATY